MEVVDGLRAEGGAVCFATQNVEELGHADRVVALLGGRVTEQSVEELFA